MNTERESLSQIYPEIEGLFPGLSEAVDEFVQKHQNHVATRETPPRAMKEYAKDLVALARIIAEGIKKRDEKIPLFRWATLPARKVGKFAGGRIGLGEGKLTGVSMLGTEELYFHTGKNLENTYFILEQAAGDKRASVLIGLLQRVPQGRDTGAEIHMQGAECYLSLTPGIEITVNDETFTPEPLESIIIILPHDTHHHIKREGGPGRVLIFGAYGFTRGEKTEEDRHVEAFSQIPRIYEA